MTILKCFFNGAPIEVASDSGSDIICLGWNHYRSLCSSLGYDFDLRPTSKVAYAANGSLMNFAGVVEMTIGTKYISKNYPVYVQKVSVRGKPLLSEEALLSLGFLRYSLDGKFACSVTSTDLPDLSKSGLDHQFTLKLRLINEKYHVVFKGLGRLRNYKAHFKLKPGAQPFVKQSLPVPLFLRDAVEKKLQYFIDQGVFTILGPTAPAKFICSLICVPKKQGQVRLCSNMKPLNQLIERSRYVPSPRLEDFQQKLAGCNFYGSIDLKECYYQFPLDGATAELCNVSCPNFIVRYNVLPMGCSISGDIVDERLGILLKPCKRSINLRDDVIFGANTLDELCQEYEQILSILATAGLTINKDKVLFGLTSIEFYGHSFNKFGMSPSLSKISDLQQASMPKNQKGLVSWICFLEWQQRYIFKFSQRVELLRNLSKTKGPMRPLPEHFEAFESLKKAISADTLLTHFNPNHQTYIFCDAGQKGHSADLKGGLCAILAQTRPGRPGEYYACCFASRVLSDVESRYSQIEAELLACVFGLLKFSYYIEGSPHTTICFTDAQALIPLFKKMAPSTPKRLFHLFLKIQHLNIDLQWRSGKLNCSDFLSRAPNSEASKQPPNTAILPNTKDIEAALVQSIESQSDKMCLSIIRENTLQDPELCALADRIIKNDWESHKKSNFIKPYYSQKDEYYIVDDIIWRNNTIVVPTQLRKTISELCHQVGHLGITGSINLLKQFFTFPNFSSYVQNTVKSCSPCQFTSRPATNTKEPAKYYLPPPIVFHSVCLDFKDVKSTGSYVLALVCLYSSYIEVYYVNSTSFSTVQSRLSDYFARHLPKMIIHDNGPPMNGQPFKDFCKANNVEQRPISALHPQGNPTESANRTLDKAMARAELLGTDFKIEISNAIRAKNATIHPSSQCSPFELVYKKRPDLNLLSDYDFSRIPSTIDRKAALTNIEDFKKATKTRHDSKANVFSREFHINDPVLVCLDLGAKKKRFEKEIYTVVDVKPTFLLARRNSDGRVLRRHKNHFKIFHHTQHQQQQQKNNNIETESDSQLDEDDEFYHDNRQAAAQPVGPVQQQAADRPAAAQPVVPAQQQAAAAPAAPARPARQSPLRPAAARARQNIQQQERRVQFEPLVNVLEIPARGHQLRSRGEVENHPNVMPTALERSGQQRQLARERIAAHQQRQQEAQEQDGQHDQQREEDDHQRHDLPRVDGGHEENQI